MSKIVIDVENLSKAYDLGTISSGTLSRDLSSAWARFRGKEDPNSRITADNDLNTVNGVGTVWALKDINLKVNQGEILGIIGKNGAGKSTLLKILSRITSPTNGNAKIRGRIASLLEIGTGFHPELTGRENIYLNGAIMGMTKKEIDSKLDAIINFSGIDRYIDTPVKRYSSGMGVRLGFSVAAHLDPEILLIDEVLAVGDAEFQKKCLGKMNRLSENGRTILFVSHNMASIKKLCTKVVLLKNGEIKKIGEPFKTVNYYLQSISNNNINTSAIVDLNNYKERYGTGEVIFKWAMLKNSKNEEMKSFSLGDDIKLVFELEANGRDSGFTILIELKSSDGTPLYKIFDHFSGFNAKKITPNSSIISVTFEDIRLYPDKYYLTICLRDYQGEYYDFAKDCLSFEIVDGGDHTQMPLSTKDGRFFIAPIWEYLNQKPLDIVEFFNE